MESMKTIFNVKKIAYSDCINKISYRLTILPQNYIKLGVNFAKYG